MRTFIGMHLLAHRLHLRGHVRLARAVRNLNQVVHGGFVGNGASVDPSVVFVHNGLGVVIHEDASVGAGARICQQVTLGVADLSGGGAPTVGEGVVIGAGAKVLGPVSVGDGAVIGANAVVLRDVPAGATVAGVPARVVRGPAS